MRPSRMTSSRLAWHRPSHGTCLMAPFSPLYPSSHGFLAAAMGCANGASGAIQQAPHHFVTRVPGAQQTAPWCPRRAQVPPGVLEPAVDTGCAPQPWARATASRATAGPGVGSAKAPTSPSRQPPRVSSCLEPACPAWMASETERRRALTAVGHTAPPSVAPRTSPPPPGPPATTPWVSPRLRPTRACERAPRLSSPSGHCCWRYWCWLWA